MSDLSASPQHGHRLVQLGAIMFVVSLLIGLGVSQFARGLAFFAAPRLALAAHLIGLMQGTFLIAIGTIWPRLRFSHARSRVALSLLVYGFFAAWLSNLLGGVWGAGGAMLPNAGGLARGTHAQEAVIAFGLRSAAISQIAAVLLIIWGLRQPAATRPQER
jgi:hydroxylaminobenzene mutase